MATTTTTGDFRSDFPHFFATSTTSISSSIMSSSTSHATSASSTLAASAAAAASATVHTTTKLPACIPKPTSPSHTKISGDFDLNQIFLIVSTACIIVSSLISLILVLTHLMWRYDLGIQKQYMRIALLLPVFAALNYGTLWAYGDNTYFQAATKIYETFCMTCFYSYMIYLKFPDPNQRLQFFVGLERQHRRKNKGRLHDKGSLRWYYVRRMSVFQAPVVATLIFIIDILLGNLGCPTSMGSQIASGVFEFVGIISTVMAISGILQTYRRLRDIYKGSGMTSKFFAFKGFVLVIVHQQFVFAIIQLSKSVPPTEYMSSADLNYGIPAFMVCCETLLFAPIFAYAFSGFPFRRMLKQPTLETAAPSPHSQSLGAYLQALFFPMDFFEGLAQGGKTIAGYFPGTKPFDYTGGTGVGFLERQEGAGSTYQKQSVDESSDSDFAAGQMPPQPPTYNVLGNTRSR